MSDQVSACGLDICISKDMCPEKESFSRNLEGQRWELI